MRTAFYTISILLVSSFFLFSHQSYALGVGAITGSTTVCVGSNTTLADTTAGGVWSSSSPLIATVNSVGVVNGVAAGAVTITYTFGSYIATHAMAVSAAPAAGTIAGGTTVCLGSTLALTDTFGGGSWSSSLTSVAYVGSGIVTGLSAGTATISYTVTNACGTAYATYPITVQPLPAAIAGSAGVCSGSVTTLTDATSGGTWSSSTPTVATIGASTGIATPVAVGTTTITYALSTGCSVYRNLTVDVAPLAGTISGGTTVCSGSTLALTDTFGGGSWSSSLSSVADASFGLVTGLSAGTATISYTVTNACGSAYATYPITVLLGPAAIAGSTSVCTGTATTLTDAISGGTWSSSTASVATIGATTGIATGVATGTTTITYALTSGCSVYRNLTVDVAPVAGTISGGTTVCSGSTLALTDTFGGGSWSSSLSSVADASYGIVTGLSAGTATISYTVTNACGSAYSTYPITVLLGPAAIAGSAGVCTGSVTTLTDAISGGTWSSSTSSVASIGSTTGIATGVAVGTTTITYALTSGCSVYRNLTVSVAPVAGTISGGSSVCPGSTLALTDTFGGGSWSSSLSSVANVSSGLVTGVSSGTATISYTVTNSCGSAYATHTVTVLPSPAVTAAFTLGSCNGGIDTLTASGATTYSWLPTTGLSCPTCAVTEFTGMSSGTYHVTGSMAGCSSTASVTVDANRISGFISFSSTPPASLGMKVWLIQFSSIDSSLTALDSQTTCLAGGSTPYYEFLGKPAGNYMVKAKLLSSIPGTSDYIPTYGYSNMHWDSATTITHMGTIADTMHINMLYGAVPSGPGFIGGLIVSGAGKGTSGDVPVSNMLVYLENATTHQVYTYTYTDTAGAYSFSNLALGSYIIYPVDYHYATIIPPVITLTSTTDSFAVANFKEHTTLGTITSFSNTSIKNISGNPAISVYPNPTTGLLHIDLGNTLQSNATIVISDIIGREVYSQVLSGAQTNSSINISSLKDGIYLITVKGNGINYCGRLEVRR